MLPLDVALENNYMVKFKIKSTHFSKPKNVFFTHGTRTKLTVVDINDIPYC